MQYVRLGSSGLIVSRLAFGAMTFGQVSGQLGAVHKIGADQADLLVNRALDAGINFFDTADMYAEGQCETILGRALGSRRKEVVISTKVGFRSGQSVIQAGASYGYILAATEASLRRLNTDYVDLLSIHKLDPYTPFEESARALENLAQRGLVRYVGYSNLNAWQAAKFLGIQTLHNYAPFVAAQMYYSLVGRDLEQEIVPFCQDSGIGIVVWSPLAGGFLTGRYTRQDPTGGKGRLATFDILPVDREKGYALIDKVHVVAQRHRASVAQVALGWLLAKPYVTSLLLGASTVSQLEDNLKAGELKLAAEEIAELDEATAPVAIYPNWFHQATMDIKTREALTQGLSATSNKAA